VFSEPGGPEVLGTAERMVREPGPGEVRIRVRAAAVNPTDLLLREQGAGRSVPPPWVPGMDAAGTVEAVGAGVERLRPEQPVMAIVKPRRPDGGAQSELIVVPADSVVPMPTGATFEEASTLPMNGLTAILGIELLGLEEGQTLAVSGGAGLLASYTIPFAKARGLRVVADAAPADEALVRGYGADVVVPRERPFAEAVRVAVPDGADALYDAAALETAAFGAVRDGGAAVVVRGWSDVPVERGIRVHPVYVVEVLERLDWLEEVRAFAEAGRIRMRVAATYSPEQIADAHRAMAAGGLRGRAVIRF
jgi:NADPH:quinone reductase-like Zn-dependent oxidoreductase